MTEVHESAGYCVFNEQSVAAPKPFVMLLFCLKQMRFGTVWRCTIKTWTLWGGRIIRRRGGRRQKHSTGNLQLASAIKAIPEAISLLSRSVCLSPYPFLTLILLLPLFFSCGLSLPLFLSHCLPLPPPPPLSFQDMMARREQVLVQPMSGQNRVIEPIFLKGSEFTLTAQ